MIPTQDRPELSTYLFVSETVVAIVRKGKAETRNLLKVEVAGRPYNEFPVIGCHSETPEPYLEDEVQFAVVDNMADYRKSEQLEDGEIPLSR